MATTPLVSFPRSIKRPIFHLYDTLGWSIIPVDADTKGALIPWRQFIKKRPGIADVEDWSRRFPRAGIAVVTGMVSGIVVLDADGVNGREEALRMGVPRTPMVNTPSGGFHAYFKHPGFAFTNTTKLGESHKIDIRGDAGYVLAPHTKRADGRKYEWIEHPERVPLAPAPKWFLKMLKDHPVAAKAPACGSLSVSALGEEMTSLIARMPPKLRELVLDGHDLERFPSRSECDFFVLVQLVARGFSVEEIEVIFASCAIGEKVREEGTQYLDRSLQRAQEKVRLVTIKYADLSDYDGGGRRVHLCLVDESNGQVVRCGVTVPSNSQSVMHLRWAHLFEAVGLPVPIGKNVEAFVKRLLGQKMRIEFGEQRENPVGAFHRVMT